MEATQNPANQASPQDGSAGATDELSQLKAKIDELEQKNLRAIADGRNIAQRATREKHDAIKFAEAEFARELLPILDDLERTQESSKTAKDAATISDGVRITYEHFVKLLKSRNIQAIEAVGKPFDPHMHEALLQQPSADVPSGDVIQEVQRGYMMHERVLRPARVIVSSGPAAH